MPNGCSHAAVRPSRRAAAPSHHRRRVRHRRHRRDVLRHAGAHRYPQVPDHAFAARRVRLRDHYLAWRLFDQVRHRHQDRNRDVHPDDRLQILAFFLPALKPNERRWVVAPTVLAATVLFFVGVSIRYAFIVPAGFEWMIGETNMIGQALPELQDYINIEILLMIGFGVAFELPLIVFYLAVFHIVPYTVSARLALHLRHHAGGLRLHHAGCQPCHAAVHVCRHVFAVRDRVGRHARRGGRARGQVRPVLGSRLNFLADDEDEDDE